MKRFPMFMDGNVNDCENDHLTETKVHIVCNPN